MNKYFLNIIYAKLKSGIESGYRHGIGTIVKMNIEKKFTDAYNFSDDNPLYSINWTKADKLAVKRFLREAFMVAGVGSYGLQEELKKLGVQVIEGEIPDFDTFELEVRKKMIQYGIGLGEQPPTGWLETNLNTAITASVHAARWNRVNDPDVTDVYPALQYRTQRDEAVRDEHRLLEGKVFMKSDPVWDVIYPPNGWGCRCFTVPVTGDEELMNTAETTTKDTRKEYEKEVAPDFRHNSGKDKSVWGRWLKMQLRDMPDEERKKLKDLLRVSG